MEIKEHTRNQKRMYRIHKQEEKIQNLELLIGKLQRENDKLKKQYEKVLNDYCGLDAYNKTQQKEFIKWLEDYLKLFDTMDIEEQASYDTIEEILQKYRSIIGDDK